MSMTMAEEPELTLGPVATTNRNFRPDVAKECA